MADNDDHNHDHDNNDHVDDRRITNFESFQTLTNDKYQVAGLYFYMQLDCLIELAYRVSRDFFKRPHLYINLRAAATLNAEPGRAAPAATEPNPTKAPDEEASEPVPEALSLEQFLAVLHERFDYPTSVPEVLAVLRGRYGYHERFPSMTERDEIYRHMFGRGGAFWLPEEGDFPRLRDALVSAATAFAERVFNTGVGMLRERVRIATVPFRQYLRGLHGDSIIWSRAVLGRLTEESAYRILRNPGVAGIFGIDQPPEAPFPYLEDANGDKLVESIAHQLKWPDPSTQVVITREAFTTLQRAAKRGAEAIVTVLDFEETDSTDDLDRLITKAYTWGAALQRVTALATAAQPTPTQPATEAAPARTTLYGVPEAR